MIIKLETAILAKKKGFDRQSYHFYDPKGKQGYDYNSFWGDLEGYVFAHSQSDLQTWLREKHDIIVSIIPHFYGSYSSPTVKYRYKVMTHEDNREFNKWEDCLELGLLEALNEIKLK